MGQRQQAKGCKYKGIYGHCFGRIFAECKLAENGIQRIPQPGAEAVQQRGARDGQRTAERSRDAGAACDGQRQRGQLAPGERFAESHAGEHNDKRRGGVQQQRGNGYARARNGAIITKIKKRLAKDAGADKIQQVSRAADAQQLWAAHSQPYEKQDG